MRQGAISNKKLSSVRHKKKDTISTNLLSSAFLYEQIYSKFLSMP
jgi:hypothetical protein